MTIRRTANPLAEDGYTLTLDHPDDLAALEEDVRASIGPALEALFIAPRQELARIDASSLHAPTRALCAALVDRVPTIEINVADPLDPWTADVFARFRGASSVRSIGLRAPLSTATLPRSCPPAIREFYVFFGGINLRYGWSGELVMPHRIRSASSILTEHGLDSISALDEAHRVDAYGFWEVDGDWLCWFANGEVGWIGLEWNESACFESIGTVDSALLRLYTGAVQGERLHV